MAHPLTMHLHKGAGSKCQGKVRAPHSSHWVQAPPRGIPIGSSSKALQMRER